MANMQRTSDTADVETSPQELSSYQSPSHGSHHALAVHQSRRLRVDDPWYDEQDTLDLPHDDMSRMPTMVTRVNDTTTNEPATPSWCDPEYLRHRARWIRDILDPQVARDGADALHSDEALTLDELLRRLLDHDMSLADIRFTRMHLAISEISGKATRWPKKLIDRCEAIKVVWEAKYGPLKTLGTPLYEPRGRLHDICRPEDLNKEKLLVKWLGSPAARLSPSVSRKVGDLGFVPGDWWISPMFAYRAGIIDSGNPAGGIVADGGGAYAIVLTDSDEVAGSDSNHFRYRARDGDPGRYRLTAATPESRQPIRILRSHTLHSFLKPRAGIRYDGLHTVTGWTVKQDAKTSQTVVTVSFMRLSSEVNMDAVLCRPWSDEVEDYTEYKRLRREHHDKKDGRPPSIIASDGANGHVWSIMLDAAVHPTMGGPTARSPDEERCRLQRGTLGSAMVT
ncbi:hypothetical protein DOTSEDRAFT_31847 [Dothistroma septosporum NZE10]|uniref:YDG domain-containing protein n=1 Tax=Dothistroma septosporum (strain NZE10 / CBS 128990) TaxID=675120 RepID=N1PVA4_DOTSN|nr:hypothetical protein DOTSEDRAFT_31847 [Dothistroma septosporum NZE10]